MSAPAASSTAASAAHVHFQPSPQLMESSATHVDDDESSSAAPAPRSSNGRRKHARGSASASSDRSSSSAAAAAVSEGNNTSPPALSVKADRALRALGGKKALHTDAFPNPSKRLQSRSPHSSQERRRGSGNSGGGASAAAGDRDTPKKRPMRPIEDVLSRIRHEVGSHSHLEGDAFTGNLLDHFSLAYIDRVWGDQEVSFTEFFDPRNDDTKDVPLHRISYVRFFDEIIWNRAARFDAVFGSANSNAILPEWIERTEELRAKQEERWARMLAAEAQQAKQDQIMLARLGMHIAEQREEIEARQRGVEEAGSTTSGFDFGEERMRDIEEVEAAEASAHGVAAPETSAPMDTSAAPAAASSTAAPADDLQWGADGVAFEALPQRAPKRRGGAASAVPAAAVTAASSVATTPAQASAVRIDAPAASAAAAAGASSSSAAASAARPYCDDDGHISVRISLVDSSFDDDDGGGGGGGHVVRSTLVRVSTAHFDWNFLRKRIASKLHISGGAREVKRLYLQRGGPGGDAIRIGEHNFSTLLRDGSELVLMAEHGGLSAALDAPKVGEQETRADTAKLARIGAPLPAPAASSSSSSAPRAAPTRRPAAAGNDRPNHFVSLRITSPELLDSLAQVQAGLLAHEARYAPFLVAPGTFHITLSLLCINGREQAAQALAVFQSLESQIRALLLTGEQSSAGANDSIPASSAPLSLPLHGVGSFPGDSVVFAEVPRGEARSKLNQVAKLLATAFAHAGVGCSQNDRSSKGKGAPAAAAAGGAKSSEAAPPADQAQSDAFTPHLTLAKLSRARPSAHGAGGKRGGKHASQHRRGGQRGGKQREFRPQQQRTGIEELAGDEKEEEEDDATAASSLALPSSNAFLALARDASTTSSASVAADVDDAESESAAPASAAISRPASTSVIRRLDSASYRAWRTAPLGAQSVQLLDLCAMQGAKDASGYYPVLGQVRVGEITQQ